MCMRWSLLVACFCMLAVQIRAQHVGCNLEEKPVSLANLFEGDQQGCLELIAQASTEEMWGVFLIMQTDLFFPNELPLIERGAWWQRSQRILDLGSGNGAYLHKLAERFPEKSFLGIDKLPDPVEKAVQRYAQNNLSFQVGDAEIFQEDLEGLFDLVLFRLTLQHLRDPLAALKNAARYLAPGGHILIIDSCDEARSSNHPIPSVDKALQWVADLQQKAGKGNRKITLELMQALENHTSPLSHLYAIAYSNLDSQGQGGKDKIWFGKTTPLFCNQGLLFLQLLHRVFGAPVDFQAALEEFHEYFDDKEAKSSPGTHCLVLCKKPSL